MPKIYLCHHVWYFFFFLFFLFCFLRRVAFRLETNYYSFPIFWRMDLFVGCIFNSISSVNTHTIHHCVFCSACSPLCSATSRDDRRRNTKEETRRRRCQCELPYAVSGIFKLLPRFSPIRRRRQTPSRRWQTRRRWRPPVWMARRRVCAERNDGMRISATFAPANIRKRERISDERL